MGKLQQAFEQPDTVEESSFLTKLFCSPLIRGNYKDEKPVVDVKLCGSTYEKRRMTSLINTIANSSPTGRQILEDAAKAGYSFGFEMQPGSYGFCCMDDKVIRLNPFTKDSKLTSTLAHEARHAQQNTRNVPAKFCEFDVATELKLRRATEADAQAAAVQVALEIRAATKNGKVWNAFSQTEPDLTRDVEVPSISESVDSVSANKNKTMQEAFKGWFKNWRIVDAYEQGYLYGHLRQIEKCNLIEAKELFEEKPFNGHKTSADILKMVCASDNGKCYFEDDLDIMDRDSRMCGMCKETRTAANVFFSEREKITGQAPDTSYQDLPDRGGLFKALQISVNGMAASLKQPSEKKAQQSMAAALMKRMQQGR